MSLCRPSEMLSLHLLSLLVGAAVLAALCGVSSAQYLGLCPGELTALGKDDFSNYNTYIAAASNTAFIVATFSTPCSFSDYSYTALHVHCARPAHRCVRRRILRHHSHTLRIALYTADLQTLVAQSIAVTVSVPVPGSALQPVVFSGVPVDGSAVVLQPNTKYAFVLANESPLLLSIKEADVTTRFQSTDAPTAGFPATLMGTLSSAFSAFSASYDVCFLGRGGRGGRSPETCPR